MHIFNADSLINFAGIFLCFISQESKIYSKAHEVGYPNQDT